MAYKEEPVRYLHRVLEVVEEAGYEATPFIEDVGLTREQIADPKLRMNFSDYLGVIRTILESTEIPGLALKAGQHTALVDHGILGYAFISSANLRTAMNIFMHYQKIQGPLVNVSMHQEGNEGVYTSAQAVPDLSAVEYWFAVEQWVAEATQFRELFEKPLVYASATVTYPQPAWSDMYTDLLGCAVVFDADKNEIRFPAEYLDMPFSLAEPSVAELCTQQCDEILRQMDTRPDVVDDVRRVILSKPGAVPSLDNVAEKLFVSPRTLRRRLYDAGTSFREIVADVRMKLAMEYLSNTALPTAEIAFLLGYSDVTAFHRSFKKLQSTTPAAYRDSAKKTAGIYSVTAH